jgi:hypothetical protein
MKKQYRTRSLWEAFKKLGTTNNIKNEISIQTKMENILNLRRRRKNHIENLA